jgi:hypothetical protein
MKTTELEIKEGTFEVEVREVNEELSKFNGFISYSDKNKVITVEITNGKIEKEQVFEGEMTFSSRSVEENGRFYNYHQLYNIKTSNGLELTDLSKNSLRNVLVQLY